MCGIAGVCHTAETLDPRLAGRVDAMTERLHHRGPDASGTYADASCRFGHRRLRIIDLSDRARQPMTSPDGSVVVMFNGEIYNFRALRSQLAAKYELRSTSDTEVILHGYREWGTGVFERLNGMFAIAVWEPRARRLVLARDRLGKKPLFYTSNAGVVAFGSELKALLELPDVRDAIDPQALAAYFALGYVPTPRSIFEGVHKVPAASYLVFEAGSEEVHSYWQLPTDEAPLREADALDQLDELLANAVQIRLESDVPLGFFLSGGVDSTLITAIGKKLRGDVRTFCVGFRDPAFDEAPRARAIAEHLGTRHTELYLDDHDFSGFVDRAVDYFDEPFADSSLIATYHLAKITREHVTVALSGDGGDELFCGYERYQQVLRTVPVLRLPAALRGAVADVLERLPADRARKLGGALHSASPAELARWLVAVWKPDELAELIPGVRFDWESTGLARAWSRFAHRDLVAQLAASDIASYLCDDILQKTDRAAMAVALEMRAPLLDYRIAELAMRLPTDLKYRGSTTKVLLRKLLARYVPPRLWEGPKHGLNVPIAAWYRGPRRASLRSAIDTLASRFPEQLSRDVMVRYADDHLAGKSDYARKLFSIEMLASWITKYQRT